jgi:CRP-like cAMP-binding protein
MAIENIESPVNLEDYRHLLKELTVPAKTILLQEGDIARNGYFIKQGCLRLWFNNKGKDVTFQFFFEGEGVSSMESFRSGEPSMFSIESIEPTTVYVISKKLYDERFLSNPDFKDFVNDIMLKRLSHYSRLFMSYIKNTPEERYRELLKEHPHIIKRIPQHYIASYLGITSVSLSRIRNRV